MRPLCFLRFKEFTTAEELQECHGRCAALMRMEGTDQYEVCAVALIARKLSGGEWVPVNYVNEVDR